MDGIEVKLRKDQLDLYDRILKEVSDRFELEFETETYKSIFYASVNSYIAINEAGYVKEKGEFVRKPELGNSTDFLIIANVLGDYFVKGMKPEDAILNYKDIFLFCGSQKVSKQFDVYWNGEKLPQRLNRYYASKRGAYLYKLEKDESWQKRIAEAKTPKDKKRIANSKPNFQHLLKESGVQLYNVHEDKPIEEYGINYSFYLRAINKRIAEIERLNQLTLQF